MITDSNCELLKQLYLKQKEVNTLRIAESTFNFDLKLNEEVCDICKNWANTMTGGNQNDPIFLRQVMENYKLKVIQDMNSLKRLLREAEADHYALFKAFVFLRKCPSSPIVMWHIRMEALVSMPRSICYVIAVLDEFITDKGGFAKIRAGPAMP
ncbi:protein Njmu-R1-like [Xenia sp. Carnegie-2017]|uniref:protein Njmu-R1-like n=1 Tax=Xenia sp. Carnegie-2017 TaxID=2897299 RepID=UPI001F044149|nr:protein Njmu-R1-like [Xenia sp. Carnegie-2017]